MGNFRYAKYGQDEAKLAIDDPNKLVDLDPAAISAVLRGGLALSPYCRFVIPTLQGVGSGSAKDVSGNNRHLALGNAVVDDPAGLWSNTSRELNALATIVDGTAAARYLYMPSWTTPWNLSDWFIFSCILQPTVAPQARNFFGCGWAGQAAGWYLKGDAAGKLYVVIINGALGVGGNSASTPVLTASGQRSHITIAVDPKNKDIFLYVNGILVNSWLNSWTGTGEASNSFTLASDPTNAVNTAKSTYGMLIGAIQYYTGPVQLPAHHAAIAQRLAANPFTPLGYFDL